MPTQSGLWELFVMYKLNVLCRKDNHEWINWYMAYVFRSHHRMHLSIRDGFYI